MSNGIQQLTRPLALAELGGAGTTTGSLALAKFARLAAALDDERGEVSVVLQFDEGAGPYRPVHGSLQTELTLTCQRCLRPLAMAVDTQFDLALVRDESALGSVPAELEPVIAEDGMINMLDVLEDELLLCLPIAPRHAAGTECAAQALACEQETAQNVTSKPFAVLRELNLEQPPEKS